MLPGIGPRSLPLLERLVGGPKVSDLLWHAPIEIIDRSYNPRLADAEAGRVATLRVQVIKHTPNTRKNLPYRINCTDGEKGITLVFFHGNRDWLQKQFPLGAEITISGKLELYQEKWQMVHPEHSPGDLSDVETYEPVYPLTQGITNKMLRKAMKSALDMVPALPEWMDKALQTKNQWPGWQDALHTLHKPEKPDDLLPDTEYRLRLAYDECLANQLTLALVRLRQSKKGGRSFDVNGTYKARLMGALPFSLTGAQIRVCEEIAQDMKSSNRMMRLLQGDVGGGKTVVAALTMMHAVDTGTQAALMAPTEILARQHAESL